MSRSSEYLVDNFTKENNFISVILCVLIKVTSNFFFVVSIFGSDRPVVQTSLGSVRGYYKQSYNGRTYLAFEGIPYAKPPVGALRFKEPQNVDPWIGVWNATVTYTCMQVAFLSQNVIGNEDCLYLNVYVPNEQPISNDNLDVIVYIHGGAFMMGSPELGVPTYLMDRDVIYVSMNYRLNILGFLSTEDNVVPGNNGLKDQAFALKWVQNNIKQFGGNPKSVTIIGLSAGGASVHYHYFSQLSKGLFHRGVSQSGTVFCPWAFQKAALEKAKRAAAFVGCDNPSTNKMVECMRERSARQLVENVNHFVGYSSHPIGTFVPVVEKGTETAFLADHPYNLLKNGNINDVPWITSITKEEGIMFILTVIDKLDELEERWDEVIPHMLDFNYTVLGSDKLVVAQKIKEFYFAQEKLSYSNIKSLAKLLGDRTFVLPFEETARLQTKVSKSPVYAYLYDYSSERGVAKALGLNVKGVTHGDDGLLQLPMGKNFMTGEAIDLLQRLSSSDELIKELLLDMLTSLAKNGKPKIPQTTWEPLSDSEEFKYLFIGSPDDIKMDSVNELTPTQFWKSLPFKENGNIVSIKDEL